ncbi:MAG: 3-dehydroquinate synthase [Actinobacteria bacterium]|nr:3-dehydroquinate synthase [Actinomycetota bacterium]
MSDVRTVRVELGDRSYPVVVGRGARHELPSLIPNGSRRVAIVTQESIPAVLIPAFAGRDVHRFVIGDGEDHKSLSTIEELMRGFSRAGLTRTDCVVGVGGGLVTDVAGFAAASYHRGIPVAHVATTLLAMVDAAIGGKTGVNIPEGKNLVGAFWQPCAVACDTDALDTLPESESRCGRGEMAKYHFIVREDLSTQSLEERIAACVRIKAEVVAGDERESGRRALLNYGHTLAHAIEVNSGWTIAHGEAVAIGLVFAAHLAHVLGRIDDRRVADHYAVVKDTYGLSTALPKDLDDDALIESMKRDKKALSSLTFVLDSRDGLEVIEGIDEAKIRDALKAHRGYGVSS